MSTAKGTAPRPSAPVEQPSEEQRISLKAAGGSNDHAVNMELVKRTFATASRVGGAFSRFGSLPGRAMIGGDQRASATKS